VANLAVVVAKSRANEATSEQQQHVVTFFGIARAEC
jgi:hypothetical protein